MKIVFDSATPAKLFGDLVVGDVFYYDSRYYLKVYLYSTDNVNYANAVLLRNNPDVTPVMNDYTIVTFANSAEVHPVNATLTISQLDAEDTTADTDENATVNG